MLRGCIHAPVEKTSRRSERRANVEKGRSCAEPGARIGQEWEALAACGVGRNRLKPGGLPNKHFFFPLEKTPVFFRIS